jgi:hypothetical protein
MTSMARKFRPQMQCKIIANGRLATGSSQRALHHREQRSFLACEEGKIFQNLGGMPPGTLVSDQEVGLGMMNAEAINRSGLRAEL